MDRAVSHVPSSNTALPLIERDNIVSHMTPLQPTFHMRVILGMVRTFEHGVPSHESQSFD